MIYNQIEIYTSTELEKLRNDISDKYVGFNIVLRGKLIENFNGFKQLKNSLSIIAPNLQSLGDLKVIEGNLSISSSAGQPNLKSLGKLEQVIGEVYLRRSNISCLGALCYVNGKLNLRDTPINDLGALKFVGGDLFLPKRLEGKVNLDKIEVKGNVRFWKDENYQTTKLRNTINELQKSEIEIPYWRHSYIFSFSAFEKATNEQKKFYNYFKTEFLKNKFIDLQENNNYIFILFYDFLNQYLENRNFDELIGTYSLIVKYYPITSTYSYRIFIDILKEKKRFEEAWEYEKKLGVTSIRTIWEYQQLLKQNLFDATLILGIANYNHLTDFGKRNIKSLTQSIEQAFINYEEKLQQPYFLDLFLDNNLFYKKVNGQYSSSYYLKFYLSDAEYDFYRAIDEEAEKRNQKNSFLHVVEKAVINQLKVIVKQGEDLYRVENGMPKIGEGWISETELFYKLKTRFIEQKVIQHGNPKWLGRQHIDIFFPNLNIGIEYQGLQHYEPIDFFGGEEAFIKNQERDLRKKNLCIKHNCHLIYVNRDYNIEDLCNEINLEIVERTK